MFVVHSSTQFSTLMPLCPTIPSQVDEGSITSDDIEDNDNHEDLASLQQRPRKEGGGERIEVVE